MEKNQLNSGSIDTLEVGQTLLISARQVSNGKISLEFAEKVTSKDRPVSALTILNASDDRFSSGARRGWASAEPVDASSTFNVNFGDDGEWYTSERGEMMDLDILNPEFNGMRFRVQITETTEPTEWQAENLERAAKRAGKDGDYITHSGDYIFSNSDMIVLPEGEEPKHTWLTADTERLKAKTLVEVEAEEEIENLV
tara:strand:- start:11434 stop:12027 length:594 start_codon:yes stop_codon:yes gene_type:complete